MGRLPGSDSRPLDRWRAASDGREPWACAELAGRWFVQGAQAASANCGSQARLPVALCHGPEAFDVKGARRWLIHLLLMFAPRRRSAAPLADPLVRQAIDKHLREPLESDGARSGAMSNFVDMLDLALRAVGGSDLDYHKVGRTGLRLLGCAEYAAPFLWRAREDDGEQDEDESVSPGPSAGVRIDGWGVVDETGARREPTDLQMGGGWADIGGVGRRGSASRFTTSVTFRSCSGASRGLREIAERFSIDERTVRGCYTATLVGSRRVRWRPRIMCTSVAMIEGHRETLLERAGAEIARRPDAFGSKQKSRPRAQDP